MSPSLFWSQSVNSLRLSDAYMHQGSWLVTVQRQVTTCTYDDSLSFRPFQWNITQMFHSWKGTSNSGLQNHYGDVTCGLWQFKSQATQLFVQQPFQANNKENIKDTLLAICNPPLMTHYNDVIMSVMASQITYVLIVYSTVCSDADQRKH